MPRCFNSGQDEAERLTLTISEGGSTDSEVTEVTVMPVISSPRPAVMTLTPPLKWRIAWRKSADCHIGDGREIIDDGIHGDLTAQGAHPAAPKQMAQDLTFQRGKIRRAAPARSREIDIQIKRDAAVFDQQHAVGQRHRLGDVVRHQQRGEALFAPHPFDQALHLDARQRVERAERLVEQQQARLAAPARARAPRAAAARPTTPPAIAARSARPTSRQRRPRARRASADRRDRGRGRARHLQHARQGSRRGSWNMMRTSSRLGAALAEADAAGIGRLQAGEQAQQRALAAAAAADDGDELARADVQVDAAQHLRSPKRLPRPSNGQRRPRGGRAVARQSRLSTKSVRRRLASGFRKRRASASSPQLLEGRMPGQASAAPARASLSASLPSSA